MIKELKSLFVDSDSDDEQPQRQQVEPVLFKQEPLPAPVVREEAPVDVNKDA